MTLHDETMKRVRDVFFSRVILTAVVSLSTVFSVTQTVSGTVIFISSLGASGHIFRFVYQIC